MKVTTDTPDLLIVEDRPVLVAIILIGFTLVFVAAGMAMMMSGEAWGLVMAICGGGMGVLFFFLFVRRVMVVFHRPEGYVEFRRKNAFRQKTVRHTLSEIDRAVIETSHSTDGGTTYRVALVIERGQSAGRHPITIVYSNGRGHQHCAEVINRWLGDG